MSFCFLAFSCGSILILGRVHGVSLIPAIHIRTRLGEVNAVEILLRPIPRHGLVVIVLPAQGRKMLTRILGEISLAQGSKASLAWLRRNQAREKGERVRAAGMVSGSAAHPGEMRRPWRGECDRF